MKNNLWEMSLVASNMFAMECPQCGRSAFEDNYYKTDETTIICYRCGYYYSKKIINWTSSPIEFEETEDIGYGVLLLSKKRGQRKRYIFNHRPTQKEMEKYHEELSDNDVDQSNSYFITFNEGKFKVEFGDPSENFYLPFEAYKEKMIKKYGEYEYSDILVPMEE